MLSFKLPGFHQPLIVRDEKGFTLIEVLIAVAMTGLIVAGVLMVMGTSSKILVVAKNEEKAKDLAASDMEYLRSQSFGSSALPNTSSSFPGFTAVAVINPFQMTEERIDITVTWNSGSYTLTDYRAEY
jgi:prepilin-type N-terminal cleavage/methylation domain-containing protein